MPPRGGRGGGGFRGGGRVGGGWHGGGHHYRRHGRPIVYNVPASPVFYDYSIPYDYVVTPEYIPAATCPNAADVQTLLYATRGRMVPELARLVCLMRYCQQRRLLPGALIPEATSICR